jgi:hypothetical protein
MENQNHQVEENIMPEIPEDSATKLKKYTATCPMRIYQLGLYLGFAEGIITTVYFIIRFIIYGFNDPN